MPLENTYRNLHAINDKDSASHMHHMRGILTGLLATAYPQPHMQNHAESLHAVSLVML